MKDFLSKILALFLAILILFSSSFIAIDSHFCCGNLVDSSIFGKADVCKMDMISCGLEAKSTTRLKDNCCNSSIVYKHRALFKKNIPINVDLEQFNFVTVLYVTTTNLFLEPEFNINYYKDYKSPLITRDILVLVQRFLI